MRVAASLGAARQPLRSVTWAAAMSVIVERDGGDLARTRRLGQARLEALTRRLIVARGRRKPCRRIVRELFTALSDRAGVLAHRPGALERAALLLQDWDHSQADRLNGPSSPSAATSSAGQTF
jgi:transposase